MSLCAAIVGTLVAIVQASHTTEAASDRAASIDGRRTRDLVFVGTVIEISQARMM